MRLGVFCSASDKLPKKYYEFTKDFAHLMAKKDMTLIYGGASIGMMGTLSSEVMNKGGKAIGVIPKVILEREVPDKNLTELIVTEDMHERKQKIYDLSDAIAVLPGGFGTLDETFEFMTWNQLGIHQKSLAFINFDNFFDPLKELFNKMEAEKFIKNYDSFEPKFFNSVPEYFKWVVQ